MFQDWIYWTGRMVRDAAALRPGDPVTARFARGEADCEVLRTQGNLTGTEVARSPRKYQKRGAPATW
jgi:hypothetical protein